MRLRLGLQALCERVVPARCVARHPRGHGKTLRESSGLAQSRFRRAVNPDSWPLGAPWNEIRAALGCRILVSFHAGVDASPRVRSSNPLGAHRGAGFAEPKPEWGLYAVEGQRFTRRNEVGQARRFGLAASYSGVRDGVKEPTAGESSGKMSVLANEGVRKALRDRRGPEEKNGKNLGTEYVQNRQYDS